MNETVVPLASIRFIGMRSLLGLGLLALGAVVGCKPAGSAGGGAAMERVVQVVTKEAKLQTVSEILSLVGSVQANEIVEIKSETDGTVESINFVEGQQVQKGDLLIHLDETKLAASLAEAEANFQLSKINFERNKQLLEEHLISQQEFDQTAAAYQANQASLDLKKRQLKDTHINAPFSGVIGARSVSAGQVIARNTTLTWLVDLDPVKVDINVPERFLGQLKVGQAIEIKVAAFPARTFLGEVFFIAPFVDPVTRTALIKARIPNPKHELIPGMFANLELTLKIRDNAVVIPEEALTKLLDNGYAMLFVATSTNTAAMKRVKVGARLPGLVEILQGVESGDRVIVEGAQKLAPGAKIREAADESELKPM